MNIVHMIERLGRGGAERYVLDVARESTARGLPSTVLARAGRLYDGKDPHVRVVPEGRRFLGWGASIRRLHRHSRFDVAVVHSLAPLIPAILFGRRHGIPVIFVLHGWEADEKRWLSHLLRLLRVHAVIAVSDELASRLRRQGVDAVVIRNAVMDANGSASVTYVAPPPLQLLSVGRLDPVKNQRLLIQALALLVAQGMDVRVTLVGEGTLKTELDQLIRELSLEERVSLPGFCDPTPYYRSHHCLVSTSVSEGLSLAHLEGLMWGMPLVVTRTSGSLSVVPSSDNGRIVEHDTPAAVAAAVAAVAKGDMQGMGKVSRRIYEENFTFDRLLDELSDAYRRVTA